MTKIEYKEAVREFVTSSKFIKLIKDKFLHSLNNSIIFITFKVTKLDKSIDVNDIQE